MRSLSACMVSVRIIAPCNIRYPCVPWRTHKTAGINATVIIGGARYRCLFPQASNDPGRLDGPSWIYIFVGAVCDDDVVIYLPGEQRYVVGLQDLFKRAICE